jgi:hypothetical protein
MQGINIVGLPFRPFLQRCINQATQSQDGTCLSGSPQWRLACSLFELHFRQLFVAFRYPPLAASLGQYQGQICRHLPYQSCMYLLGNWEQMDVTRCWPQFRPRHWPSWHCNWAISLELLLNLQAYLTWSCCQMLFCPLLLLWSAYSLSWSIAGRQPRPLRWFCIFLLVFWDIELSYWFCLPRLAEKYCICWLLMFFWTSLYSLLSARTKPLSCCPTTNDWHQRSEQVFLSEPSFGGSIQFWWKGIDRFSSTPISLAPERSCPRANCVVTSCGLGIKEVWEVPSLSCFCAYD